MPPGTTLGLCLQGSGYLIQGSQRLTFAAGQAWVVAEGLDWSLHPLEEPRGVWALVGTGSQLASLLSLLGSGPLPWVFSIDDPPAIARLFEELLALLAKDQRGGTVEIASLALGHLVGRLALAKVAAAKAPLVMEERIKQAVAYIESHLADPIGIEDVARVANLSSSHFMAMFKKHQGCSFLQFYSRRRMEKARELLTTTSLPLREVANLVGYRDPLYFSRIFRTFTGVAPSTVRQPWRRPSPRAMRVSA